MTAIVQIGNSDNKLSQEEWSKFVNLVDREIRLSSPIIYFFGGSSNWERWQNVAWVFEYYDLQDKYLQPRLSELGRLFKQDSIAFSLGETKFI